MRGGMGNLMKQAQQMQQKMLKLQEEIAKKTLDASVGGGMVTVTVNGKSEVLRIKIEPQVVDPNDVEMLEDLIVAGVNEALRKAQEMMAEEMGKLTGGLKIPGLSLYATLSWLDHVHSIISLRNSAAYLALGRKRRSASLFSFYSLRKYGPSGWRAR